MTLLGKKFDYLDDEEQEVDEYQVPAVFRQNPKEFSLKKSIAISTVLHPAVVGAVWLILVILTFLGISIPLFDKPEPKPKDIEFVLVNKEATPINKNTKYRSDRNSRAGGHHDPKRKVSMPQAAAPKAPAKKQSAAPSRSPVIKKQHRKQSQSSSPKRATKTESQEPFLPMFAPRPNVKPSPPRPTAKPKGDFAIPIPKSAIPRMAAPSGGPITGSSRGKGSGSSGSGTSRPSPSFSPSASSGSGSGARGGRFSGSYGSGSGNIGNPGPGNPKGAPGIDAIREPDFGPYMRDLQRRIKMNWEPPKGNESKRVVLLFIISRDGRLISVKVNKSSGVPSADKAAIAAVQLTAPFRPLPPEYKGSSVDIQFTFDYNVFEATRY